MRTELTKSAAVDLILTFRAVPVLIDRDIASLYGVPTKRLNEQVKRNIERFPERFCFRLSQEETAELVANCDRLSSLRFSTTPPYAFTEQGVAMLSTVLRSETAVRVSIEIMDAFVAMRHQQNRLTPPLDQRIAALESHQLAIAQRQEKTEQRLEEVFQLMDNNSQQPTQGIFFDGQIYDAYRFVADLVRSATQRIALIDNYVDDTVLTLLDKRQKNVTATIFTANITPQLQLDLKRHNSQYAPIEIITYQRAHDRFMIVDNRVYHIGASVKDLGKRLFAFSLLSDITPEHILNKT